MRSFGTRTLSFFLTLVLCAGLVPVLGIAASAAELTERQQAIVDVAMAYYDKGKGLQYDGANLVIDANRNSGGKTRSTNCEAPEYATPHETLYSVCSDFCHQVYYEALRFHLCGTPGNVKTYRFLETKPEDPTFVYAYDEKEGKNKDEEMRKLYALLQPGDILTTRETSGAHAMLFVGDPVGDGRNYLAHCYGTAINVETGRDVREYPVAELTSDRRYRIRVFDDTTGGSIRLTPVTAESLIKMAKKKIAVNAIRPLAGIAESDYPITAATRYRMTHPRLVINRTLNETRFTSATKGETLTLSIALENRSGKAYTVPVTEKIPQGVTFKKASDGGAVNGGTIAWNVDLPAGSEKTLTVEYEVTAERGEQIVFTGGSVGDIPSNTVPVTVGGAKLNADDLAKLKAIAAGDYNKALEEAKPNGAALPAYVYKNILGLNIELPDAKTVTEKLLGTTKLSHGETVNIFKEKSEVPQDAQAAYSMIVPFFHNGRRIWNEWGPERCNDPQDMHLEPGDIIIRLEAIRNPVSVSPLIYLGGGRYLTYDSVKKTYPLVEEPELVRSLVYDLFYCLRPSLAYDDLHTRAVPPDAVASPYVFPLTDVKESDWFYTYVRDLYRKGVISGMTATTFEPNGTLTYGQALKLVAVSAFEPEPPKDGKHWASGYLKLAKERGWMKEDVNLDEKITRVDFCDIAGRTRKLTVDGAKNPFTDTKNRYVVGMAALGIVGGVTETTFKPKELLTRAQIAKIIWIMTSTEAK